MLSADLLATVLQSAPDAIVIVDESGRILFVNAQISALFGYTEMEAVGQNVESLIPVRFQGAHIRHRSDYSASGASATDGGGPRPLRPPQGRE